MEFIYILLIILLFVYVQRKVYEKSAFKRFDYACSFDCSETTEGEYIHLVEVVTNAKLLPLPWLRSEISTSAQLEYAGSQSTLTDDTRFVSSFFAMRGLSKTTRTWNVLCRNRGVYPISKCVLLSTDLFGLRSFAAPVTTHASITVFPRPADLREDFMAAQRLNGDIVVRRHYVEDPFYIAGVREYTSRDSLNHIHWPATAKAGKLMVHNNQFTVDQNILIILNLQSRRFEHGEVIDKNKAERAIRIAAGFIDDSLNSGLPVCLACNTALEAQGDFIISNSFAGQEHVHDLMNILAALPLKTTMPMDDFLTNYCEHLSASDIIIATPFIDPVIATFARNNMEQGRDVKIVLAAHPDEDLPLDIPCFVYTGEEAANA